LAGFLFLEGRTRRFRKCFNAEGAESAEGTESWEFYFWDLELAIMGKRQYGVSGRPSVQAADGASRGFGTAAAEIFLVNERMNQMVIEALEAGAWRAKPADGGRNIAAIFTHVHNVRCKWVRLTAPHLKVPRQLQRARCTARQASTGLAESAARCAEMLAEALGGKGGRITKFCRDGWARAWAVGPEMLCYMVMHEAHHRGQVLMLARQMGNKLPDAVNYGVWNWEKIWKESGVGGGVAGRMGASRRRGA
jgi:uncharacterized damage-inducible protein DinB